MTKPNVTYSAPVLSVDLAYPEGEAIWPCSECLPWHFEVVVDSGNVFVREWHAADCSLLTELIG